ncbi:MAG: M48 family metallopeptidase [Eubacteriales bacterium]|nr:M48 family metallopeptidase [Eubacteriales bacterium]
MAKSNHFLTAQFDQHAVDNPTHDPTHAPTLDPTPIQRLDLAQVAPHAYFIHRSRRRTIALIVQANNQIEVRCGLKTSLVLIEQFVKSKQSWIAKKLQANKLLIPVDPGTGRLYDHLRQETYARVTAILSDYPHLSPTQITIRRQKRRWGSCNRKRQISINTSAGLLPPELLEYIVVHELCHLEHFDHSPAFYQYLLKHLPDAIARQKQLKRYLII